MEEALREKWRGGFLDIRINGVMKIHLTGVQEELVRAIMNDGLYASEGEVIDTALRLLEERDDNLRLGVLRREIGLGIEQADRGELGPFDPRATLARVRARQSS